MTAGTRFEDWGSALRELCDGIRDRTRRALFSQAPEELSRTVGHGAGDVTFGLDRPAEDWIDEWFLARARAGPLSVLTEDRGWRHAGPGRSGGEPEPLDGFDHGGPRIAIDPVDGTRPLMADLRSAWTVVSFAPPGPGLPRFGELSGGLVAEIPTTRESTVRTLATSGPDCTLEVCRLVPGEDRWSDPAEGERARLEVDADDRVDHGFFPFFRYDPELRPAIADLEARFFRRLEESEGADVSTCWDDQYISNAGQLVLLALGTYRMIADTRALVARRTGTRGTTSKPYDVGGALLCARAAGARLTAADGTPLDFPVDTETPVDFVGWANEATRGRLEPHWLATLSDTD